ncbi:DUF2637 domain-containing protein [Krasilnikovia sp. MM14-A1004]|uniref:DUF2637 domain-containing protein n=1 Tax=Krasilnikovia sp. MM14-A1004 TaxID=3373541 RepID=UPI00399D4A99
MTTTLTQQFAAEYTKRAVPGMLRAIRVIKWANKGILVGAVTASYLHQAHFLLTLGAGVFAWIVPAVFDLGIVSMLTITQTIGMATDAKRAALKVLIVVIAISAAVNAAAPGPLGLRVIFALIVGLVAGVEWVAGKIRPDFAAIEVRETELTTTSAPAANTMPVDVMAATPVHTAPPASTDRHHTDGAPARLVSAARMITVQHRQTSTQPLTADELATRLNTTPAIAGQLLATIDNPAPTAGRINGHSPVLDGVR